VYGFSEKSASPGEESEISENLAAEWAAVKKYYRRRIL
jgi:hypothetical protein